MTWWFLFVGAGAFIIFCAADWLTNRRGTLHVPWARATRPYGGRP
jgi:hypothetical protein